MHGADRADHEGTYIDRDILNWDQGLRRLALGAFMAGDASGDGSPSCGGDAYVPHEVAGTEVHDAASFGTLLRSLVADARFALERAMTTAEWATFLRVFVETYVAPSSESEADAAVAAACGGFSRSRRSTSAAGRSGYRVACELVRERLAATSGARGGEGVVVSTLACDPRRLPVPCRLRVRNGRGAVPVAGRGGPARSSLGTASAQAT